MLRQSELIKAIELQLEMDSEFNRASLPLKKRDEEVTAGPFIEHEDSHGHLTYHQARQYKD